MIEFDPYVPATWLDKDGVVFVIASKRKVKQKAKRSRAFRIVAAAASAIAISMALTDVSLSIPEYAVGDKVEVSEPIGQLAVQPDDVAPGYWPKLVRLVRDGRSLPADDTSGDPIPLA